MALYVRSYDRRHTLQLLAKGVDYELRETYESALLFGRKTLEALGLEEDRVSSIEEYARRRDLDRLALQQAEGIAAGRDLPFQTMVQEPLSKPQRTGRVLSPAAEESPDTAAAAKVDETAR